MSIEPSADSPATALRPPAFKHVLCGVDGSGSALEAARQAIVLAEPDGRVHFVSIAMLDVGLPEATSRAQRADAALEAAVELASGHGLVASSARVASEHPAASLLAAAGDHDLLAVGGHDFGRAGGMALASTTSEVLHRSPIPVLVARPPGSSNCFPDPILVATDGSADAREAARVAGRIAVSCGARIGIVAIDDGYDRSEIARSAAEVMSQTGSEPVFLVERGPAHRAIPEIAWRQDASLLVLGSRGLTGVRALGSVSERVAHTARCSVLVVRH